MQYEKIVGAQGGRLLTSRPVADAPLPDPGQNWEAYDAAMQNAVVEYDWLDPATGARSKVLERPARCFPLRGQRLLRPAERRTDF